MTEFITMLEIEVSHLQQFFRTCRAIFFPTILWNFEQRNRETLISIFSKTLHFFSFSSTLTNPVEQISVEMIGNAMYPDIFFFVGNVGSGGLLPE